jgi:hypothetical protein
MTMPVPWLAKQLAAAKRKRPGDVDLDDEHLWSDGTIGGGNDGGLAGAMGMASNVNVSAPQVNPNNFQYGGAVGGAQGTEQQYAQMAQQQGNVQGAQINNQYAGQDRAATQNVMSGEQGLQSYYQNLLNGGGTSLAQAQLNQATDQSIAAQQAAAHSAPGGLAASAAARNAATQGIAQQQQNAQQSGIARLQEEQMAAQGSAGLYGQQGSQALQEQGLNAQNAQAQAALQQQQQGINAQTQLGYGGLQNQVGIAQLGASGNQAQLQSNNQLAAQGQAIGQSQFNAGQNTSVIGAGLSAVGTLAAADVDMQEPGSERNGFILREESGGHGHAPFIAAVSKETGQVGKLPIVPLSPSEAHQVARPHGAGPLGSPTRQHTDMSVIRFGDAPGDLNGGLSSIAAPPGAFPGAWDPAANLPSAGPQQAPTLGLAGTLRTPNGPAPNVPDNWSGIDPVQSAHDSVSNPKPWANMPRAAGDPLAGTSGYGGGTAAGVDPNTLVGIRKPAAASGAPGFQLPPGGAGPARASWQSTIDPKDRAKLEAGQGAEESAQGEAAQAEQHAVEDAGVAAEKRGQAAGERADEVKADAQAHEDEVKGLLAKRDALSADAQKAGESYGWHPTTATRIRYGIAQALGAFGATLAHSQNFAAQQIDQAINRDLEAQSKQIESKKGRVADMDSMVAQAYKRFGNLDQAKAAAYSVSIEKAAAEADAYAAASKSEQVQANNKVLQAQLQQKHAEVLGQLTKPVVTGGGGDLRTKIIARGAQLVNEGKFDNVADAQRFAAGEQGAADATDLRAAGKAGKVAAHSAALTGALESVPTGAGQDFYDRNAPDFARSTDKLTEQARIAAASRAYLKAIGGREPPAGKEGDAAAIRTAVGPRATPEAVQAFRQAAEHVAARTANAPGAADEESEEK